MVCMASFRSPNGRTSSHFENIGQKLSTHVYFMMLSHSMRSKHKILKKDFMTSSLMNSNRGHPTVG